MENGSGPLREGPIRLEHRAQIPTLCFWNPVAPRCRDSVWSTLYQGWLEQRAPGRYLPAALQQNRENCIGQLAVRDKTGDQTWVIELTQYRGFCPGSKASAGDLNRSKQLYDWYLFVCNSCGPLTSACEPPRVKRD